MLKRYAKVDGHVAAHPLIQGFPLEFALRHLANDATLPGHVRDTAKTVLTGGPDRDGGMIHTGLWVLGDQLEEIGHPLASTSEGGYNWRSAGDKVELDKHVGTAFDELAARRRAIDAHAMHVHPSGHPMAGKYVWEYSPEGHANSVHTTLNAEGSRYLQHPGDLDNLKYVRERAKQLHPTAADKDIDESIRRHGHRALNEWHARMRNNSATGQYESAARQPYVKPWNGGKPVGHKLDELAARYRRRQAAKRYAFGYSQEKTHGDFVPGLAENREDMTPSLVFADWLQEQGHSGSEEVVRRSVEHLRRGPIWYEPDSAALRRAMNDARLPADHAAPFVHLGRWGTNPQGPGKPPLSHWLLDLYYPHPEGGFVRYGWGGGLEDTKRILAGMTDVPNAAAEVERMHLHHEKYRRRYAKPPKSAVNPFTSAQPPAYSEANKLLAPIDAKVATKGKGLAAYHKAATDAVLGREGVLPNVEELKALAQAGASVRGQYAHSFDVLSKFIGRDNAHLFWVANGVLSPLSPWEKHSRTAMRALRMWREAEAAKGARLSRGEVTKVIDSLPDEKTVAGDPLYSSLSWKAKRDRLIDVFHQPERYIKDFTHMSASRRGKINDFVGAALGTGYAPIDTHMAKATVPPGLAELRAAVTRLYTPSKKDLAQWKNDRVLGRKVGEMRKKRQQALSDIKELHGELGKVATASTTAHKLAHAIAARGEVNDLPSVLLDAQKALIANPAMYKAYKTGIAATAKEMGWHPNEVQEAVWSSIVGIVAARNYGIAPENILARLRHEDIFHAWNVGGLLTTPEILHDLKRLGLSSRQLEGFRKAAGRPPAAQGQIRVENPAAYLDVARRIPAVTRGGTAAHTPIEDALRARKVKKARLARLRVKYRRLRYARPDPLNYSGIIRGIMDDPQESTGHLALADWLQDNRFPGEAVARHHAARLQSGEAYKQKPDPLRDRVYHSSLTPLTPRATAGTRGEVRSASSLTFENATPEMREAPVAQWIVAPGTVRIAVGHRAAEEGELVDGLVTHFADAKDTGQLAALTADWPLWARQRIKKHAAGHLPEPPPAPPAQMSRVRYDARNSRGDFIDALRRIRSRDMQALHTAAREAARNLGLDPVDIRSALHDTPQGSVPGVAQAVYGPASPERVNQAAAWAGLTGNAPGVAVFHVRPTGPDLLHKFRFEGSGLDLRHKMDRAGLTNRVLMPHQDGFDVMVPDPGGRDAARVAQFVKDHRVHSQVSRGHFTAVGSRDQGDAREKYRTSVMQKSRPVAPVPRGSPALRTAVPLQVRDAEGVRTGRPGPAGYLRRGVPAQQLRRVLREGRSRPLPAPLEEPPVRV